jgi:hypothetical protein
MTVENKYLNKEVTFFDWKVKCYDFGNMNKQNSIYIQGQLHSNEVNSFSTLIRVVENLKKNLPPVPVRIIPMCNPIGWHSYINGNDGRISYPNGIDWNRIFNNHNKDGTLENEFANLLWDLSDGFDNIIDVHTPEYGFPHIYTSDLNKRLYTFDDIPYVISNTSSSFEDSNVIIRNIPSCTLELPNFEVWTTAQEEYWADRITNEIFHFKEDSNYSRIGCPKIVGRMINCYSKISGVPVLLVKPNEICKKGIPIAKIISKEGQTENIYCEDDCIPLCFRRRGIIQAGCWVIRILLINK